MVTHAVEMHARTGGHAAAVVRPLCHLRDQTGGQSSPLRDGEREPLQVVDDARAITSAAHAGSLLDSEQQHLENQARRGACLRWRRAWRTMPSHDLRAACGAHAALLSSWRRDAVGATPKPGAKGETDLDESEGRTSDHLTKLGERDRVRAVADVDELVEVGLRAQSRQQPVAQRFELPQLLHLHLRALD